MPASSVISATIHSAPLQNWPEYKNITGGKYYLEPPPGRSKASRYRHDITLEIFPAGSPHPVVSRTLGSKRSFVLTDEGYADIEKYCPM
jgi:hypothetical protein